MRYMLFGGECYYPSGGAEDLQDTYEDLDVARGDAYVFLNSGYCSKWAHVYDTEEKRIVWSEHN